MIYWKTLYIVKIIFICGGLTIFHCRLIVARGKYQQISDIELLLLLVHWCKFLNEENIIAIITWNIISTSSKQKYAPFPFIQVMSSCPGLGDLFSTVGLATEMSTRIKIYLLPIEWIGFSEVTRVCCLGTQVRIASDYHTKLRGPWGMVNIIEFTVAL